MITLRVCTASVAAIVLLTITARAALIQSAASQADTRNRAYVSEIERLLAGREKEPAEKVFKNIQLFKGQPAIRVLRVMDMAFVPNLGVDCTHCHTPDDWSSDSKRPKAIAREMWTLRADVQAQVRKITGNDKVPVTCYTCHKGQAIPAFESPR